MEEKIDIAETVERLRRNRLGEPEEVSRVACAGGGVSVWAVKVKSYLSYNVYKVCAVKIGLAGENPVEIGQEVEAINVAEDFDQAGGPAVGKYALMFKVGDKRLIYC